MGPGADDRAHPMKGKFTHIQFRMCNILYPVILFRVWHEVHAYRGSMYVACSLCPGAVGCG